MKFSFAQGKIVIDSYADLATVLECVRGERVNQQDFQGFGKSAWLFEEQTGSLESFFDVNTWNSSAYNNHMPMPMQLKILFRLLDLHTIDRGASLADISNEALFDLAITECYIEYVRQHRLYPIYSSNALLDSIWTINWIAASKSCKYVQEALLRGEEWINILARSMDRFDESHINDIYDCIIDLCAQIGVKFIIEAWGYEVAIDPYGEEYFSQLGEDLGPFENEFGAIMYDSLRFSEDESTVFPARILIGHDAPVLTQKDFIC